MGVLHLFDFLSTFYIIQWEFHIFIIRLPICCLSNWNLARFHFSVNFPYYSMGNLHFFYFFFKFSMLFNGKFAFCHFPMLFNGNMRLEKFPGGQDTDGQTDMWKFTPVSYRTLALWGRCPKKDLI